MIKTIDFETKTGAQNMQTDSDLLDWTIENKATKPIFRLYGWSPACVSLGRNQSDDFLDKSFLKSQNIEIVRRLTGGRALLHDNELTYLYIVPVSALKDGQSVVASYKEISQILIDAFENLGISLTFGEKKHNSSENSAKKSPAYCMSISTGADLCYQGKKLIGSAQLRKQGYILQHGSILFDYDKELTEKIFGEKTSENSLTCLKQINPHLTCDDVKEVLLTNFRSKT
jgi:lipoate-protein ligase A